MKNLMIYIGEKPEFDPDNAVLVKLQIENSLRFWKPEDIMLVTNFPYEYMGIKALVINNSYYKYDRRSCKLYGVVELFNRGLIGDEVYWNRDLDTYQMQPLGELGQKDFEVVTREWPKLLNFGSHFFKKGAESFFRRIEQVAEQYQITDENAFILLVRTTKFENTYRKLNATYDLGQGQLKQHYELAEKPIKVLHFHPKRLEMFKPYMTPELIELFKKYGYK